MPKINYNKLIINKINIFFLVRLKYCSHICIALTNKKMKHLKLKSDSQELCKEYIMTSNELDIELLASCLPSQRFYYLSNRVKEYVFKE